LGMVTDERLHATNIEREGVVTRLDIRRAICTESCHYAGALNA
jgi:hypothetical protein